MILKRISDYIIIDEIRQDAHASELYFLSHLMGHEMLTLPDNWPARIYTSKFIFDVISRKKPYVKMNFFRTLVPNVPVKFKSKEKTIMVTMFETEEITQNVMFYFEDDTTTHLYSGIFTEVHHLSVNKHFRQTLEKGIDCLYVDTTRSRGKSFIFMEDAIDEVIRIHKSNLNKTVAVIVPDFGYEAFIVCLLQKLPQKVYPTQNQRKLLARLGYSQLLGEPIESRIKLYSPGILIDVIQTNSLITVYLAEEKHSPSACGIETCQWSPFPSVMNVQELLELTRPKNIVPIKKVPLEEKVSLPASFKLFLSQRGTEEEPVANVPSGADTSLESLMDEDSNKSSDSVYDLSEDVPVAAKSKDADTNTEVRTPRKAKEKCIEINQEIAAESELRSTATTPDKVESEPVRNRMREIRRPIGFEFDDSDET